MMMMRQTIQNDENEAYDDDEAHYTVK